MKFILTKIEFQERDVETPLLGVFDSLEAAQAEARADMDECYDDSNDVALSWGEELPNRRWRGTTDSGDLAVFFIDIV